MSHYDPYTITQPSGFEDMMAHVQADCVSEFSTSGSGDNVSAFLKPELLSFTDSFKPHSLTDTIISIPSSVENFLTLPSSLTNSPSAQPLARVGDTDTSHEVESSVSTTTVPSNKEKWSRTRHRGAPLEQLQTLEQLSGDSIVYVRIEQRDEQRERKSITCKRKFEADNVKHDTEQENLNNPLNPAPVRGKRIRREKTGTEWQTVLDITTYYEQQSGQSKMGDTKGVEEFVQLKELDGEEGLNSIVVLAVG
ncbi:hypothetical protein EDD22DRAFT_853004 [Suillus occidentalis]|nr:hypothetical protein EDD22DRAFT_853004 [Suillus occidentalis]